LPELTAVPIADREICLIWRKEDTQSSSALAFVEVFRERWKRPQRGTKRPGRGGCRPDLP
jgi:DNA-binding transcriptional LysR family regulator